MDGIGKTWDRYQWVGAPATHARRAVEPPGREATWSLWQWVGAPRTEERPVARLIGEPDTSGGFSGFGVSDSGGQHWATGYAPAIASEVIDLDRHAVDERVA